MGEANQGDHVDLDLVLLEIPIALDEVVREGKVKPGQIVLTAAFGAGLTWAASVARW